MTTPAPLRYYSAAEAAALARANCAHLIATPRAEQAEAEG